MNTEIYTENFVDNRAGSSPTDPATEGEDESFGEEFNI